MWYCCYCGSSTPERPAASSGTEVAAGRGEKSCRHGAVAIGTVLLSRCSRGPQKGQGSVCAVRDSNIYRIIGRVKKAADWQRRVVVESAHAYSVRGMTVGSQPSSTLFPSWKAAVQSQITVTLL